MLWAIRGFAKCFKEFSRELCNIGETRVIPVAQDP